MTYPPPVELLPHRPPMVLVDEVLDWRRGAARCRVTIGPTSPLVHEGRVRAAAALEYMAQCVGVCTALDARAAGEPTRTGYLVGVRSMELEVGHFAVGDDLVVDAVEEHKGQELGVYRCTVARGGEAVASATLSVYNTDGPGRCGER